MVIVNADDPSMFSSQNEQDNRYYARLSGLPMLEPTNTQEMKECHRPRPSSFPRRCKLPVLLRTTTRLNHIRGPGETGKTRTRSRQRAVFQKNPFHYVAVPAVARNLHKLLLQKVRQARGAVGELAGEPDHRPGNMGHRGQRRELQLRQRRRPMTWACPSG